MGEVKVVEESKPPDWGETVCGHCPMWDVFPFPAECSEGCGGNHEEEKGLCRLNAPSAIRGTDGHGVWPVTNNDDWCAEGREIVQRLIEDSAKPTTSNG